MKRVRLIIIIICILILLPVCGYGLLKGYRSAKAETKALQEAEIPGIICIGDSLTHGTGGENVSYPYYLEEALKEDGYFMPVVNLGVGGENSITIAGRMGAIPFRVNAFTLPADNTPVQISFVEEGASISPLRNDTEANAAINPCVINGVEGKISRDADSGAYYFTRSEAGEELLIEGGSQVTTYAESAYVDGIFIIFIGTNGGYADTEDLLGQQQAILSLQQKNAGKYLIIGMTDKSAEEYGEIEAVMLEAYGDKYINLRSIFCDETKMSEWASKYDITITEEDYASMKAGVVPGCILDDGLHYTPEGYKFLEELIYERMQSLGYFDSINEAADSFNRWWGLAHKAELWYNSRR